MSGGARVTDAVYYISTQSHLIVPQVVCGGCDDSVRSRGMDSFKSMFGGTLGLVIALLVVCCGVPVLFSVFASAFGR